MPIESVIYGKDDSHSTQPIHGADDRTRSRQELRMATLPPAAAPFQRSACTFPPFCSTPSRGPVCRRLRSWRSPAARSRRIFARSSPNGRRDEPPLLPLSQKVHLLGHDSTAEEDILGQGPRRPACRPAEELTRMCPSGESHVPEGELLGTREQGKRVRRRAGEYPPPRLLLPGGLDGLASREPDEYDAQSAA